MLALIILIHRQCTYRYLTRNSRTSWEKYLHLIRSHMSGAQLERKGWRPPCVFLNIEKIVLIWKKVPDYVDLWVKFSIQKGVLRLSRKKNQIFPCGFFFLVFLTKCLPECPSSTKPPLPWKISGCAPVWSTFKISWGAKKKSNNKNLR